MSAYETREDLIWFVICTVRVVRTGCGKGIRNQGMKEFSETVLDIILLLKEADCLQYSEKFWKTGVVHGLLSFMECLLDLPEFLLAGGCCCLDSRLHSSRWVACNNSIMFPHLSFPSQALYVGLCYISSDCSSWFF